jgi:hypothetical protein
MLGEQQPSHNDNLAAAQRSFIDSKTQKRSRASSCRISHFRGYIFRTGRHNDAATAPRMIGASLTAAECRRCCKRHEMRRRVTQVPIGKRASSTSGVLLLGWCLGCVQVKEDAAPVAPQPAVDAPDDCAAVGGFKLSVNSACYMLGDTTFAWQDARHFCQAWGGDLVEIGSPEENALVAEHIRGSAWIGATDQDQEGVFRWTGGDPLTGFAVWAAGQPDNLQGDEDCSELRAFDREWRDVPCTGDVARQALCERPPPG